jgi:quinol-cytochrome oxidoreductase complex cytochrome b subunit
MRGLLRNVWRSIVTEPLRPSTDRDRARVTRFTFVLHLRPIKLPARTLRWTHTFGLGGSSLVLVTLLAATGILTMLVYQPVPDVAYDSILTLENQVRFGSLVRAVHYWSANLLVVVVLLHMARVFLTGGFHGPRRFNWVLGTVLLLCVLTSAFTGYLLPWDQLSYWAVTISTAMLEYVPWIGAGLERAVRGGAEVGAETLTTFYTVHTTIVPVGLIVFMAWHFWRVRRAGGVVVPPSAAGEQERGDKVMFLPDLLMREVSQALIVAALVFVLAAAFGAPLGERANPGMSPNPAKAPWYFVGFQELLIHFHPVFAVLVLPLLGLVGFVLLPYLTAAGEGSGAWFLSAAGRRSSLLAAVTAVVAVPALVVLDESLAGGAGGWIGRGLVPLLGLAAFAVGFAVIVRRRIETSTQETLQAVVVLLAVAFAVLTAIGVGFRGEGMALRWP